MAAASGRRRHAQVDAEKLERYAHVISKVKVFSHCDHGLPSVAISPVPQVLENLDLHKRLVMEPLLVSDELDCNVLARLPVEAFEHNAKRALA